MNQETRKGGLGRGLAALIPSGPTPSSPRLGDGAADVILGARPVPGAPKPGLTPTPGKKAGKKSKADKPDKAEQAGQPEAAAEEIQVEAGAVYQEIPIGQIVPNPHQPRQVFSEEALNELVHSIREFGLMQPIVVRETSDGFELVMGERRWRAAGRAGLKHIPAIIRSTDDGDMLRDALLENIHRVQLNPLEEAAAYQQLLEEFDVTQAELADRLGRSRPVITNTIRLLALPVAVQRRVAAGVLSAGHARALLGLKVGGLEGMEQLADRVVAEGLSVRATEEAVTLLNRGEEAPERRKAEPVAQPEMFTRAATRLGDSWDTRVTVTMGRGKGRMVVEFGDEDDFQRILGLIEGRD